MFTMQDSESPFVAVSDARSVERLRATLDEMVQILGKVGRERTTPVPPGGPAAARAYADDVFRTPLLPEVAGAPGDGLRRLVEAYASWAVDVSHPATVARMQCPPTVAAVAADLVTTALNQSMHAWEAGPFALEIERQLIAELAGLVGYEPRRAGGTVTAGGSISNIMAMLVARDEAYTRRFGRSTFDSGIAGVPVRPVVLCTETVHFSVDRGASIAGIGADGIIRVPVDERGRMRPDEADRILRELPDGQLPIMIFAVAGSTDFGWVDPLPELAEVARRHGVWLHVDAAYGGGALFSPRLRSAFAGLELADSVTMDLHKFGWVPASAGIFLTRDAGPLGHLGAQQTSLNAPDDVAEGYVGRYGASIQATRRCDALKIAATLQEYGRDGLGRMVEACNELARHGAARVAREPRLDLAGEPVLSTVLLRYRPAGDHDLNAFNSALRRRLMADGRAMLARVFLPDGHGGKTVYLKLMLLNPATRPEQVDAVVDAVLATGAALESEAAA